MITDWYDLLCIVLGVVGILLEVYLLHLNDWSIKKLLFGDKEER